MSSPRRQPLQPLTTNVREPSTTITAAKPSKAAKSKPRCDEDELFENRALLHRVLREKQMLLSRIRAQALALEQATVAQQSLIVELRELDATPRTIVGHEESERRCEELQLQLSFKDAALQQQLLENRFLEQQIAMMRRHASQASPAGATSDGPVEAIVLPSPAPAPASASAMPSSPCCELLPAPEPAAATELGEATASTVATRLLLDDTAADAADEEPPAVSQVEPQPKAKPVSQAPSAVAPYTPPAAVSISCTGFNAIDRRVLQQAAQLLGIGYSGDLTDLTTHLIAATVTSHSKKMECARELTIPVLRPAWLIDSAQRAPTLTRAAAPAPLPTTAAITNAATIAELSGLMLQQAWPQVNNAAAPAPLKAPMQYWMSEVAHGVARRELEASLA